MLIIYLRLRQRAVISSRDLPFVSGTSFQTKNSSDDADNAIKGRTRTCDQTYRPFSPSCMLYIGMNVEETMKLKIPLEGYSNSDSSATDLCWGNISEMSTQQIGPQLNMNEAL